MFDMTSCDTQDGVIHSLHMHRYIRFCYIQDVAVDMYIMYIQALHTCNPLEMGQNRVQEYQFVPTAQARTHSVLKVYMVSYQLL